MNKIILIATRELKERLQSRSFKLMAILGPIVVLCLIYMLFSLGSSSKKNWKILIADPNIILDNKIMAKENKDIHYSFINDYVEIEDFATNPTFKEFDALLEVNEKVLSNKVAFLFYKEKMSAQTSSLIQYQFERRLEEVLVKKYTDLSLTKFRQLKQPISLAIRNAFDPKNESDNLVGWLGFFFGALIILFIFMFGMTILRNTSIEKSNRIIEVLLASINTKQLLLGKIIGVGLAAFFQFLVWMLFVAIGLYVMRETLFQDFYDPSTFIIQEGLSNPTNYNHLIDLIYNQVDYGNILFYFSLFFIISYVFYATFFASLGALSGSESDGQQFVFPLIGLLLLAIYSGYFTVINPEHELVTWFSFIPFTSPIVCMIKITQGYSLGTYYHLIFSLLILLISSVIMLLISSRLYQNGILQNGHRLSLKLILKWFKRA